MNSCYHELLSIHIFLVVNKCELINASEATISDILIMYVRVGNENHMTHKAPRPFQRNNKTVRNYGASSYQIPSATTRRSNTHAMLEHIFIGQEKMVADLCGKLDATYIQLNNKIEWISNRGSMLEVRVYQIGATVRR